MSVVVVLWVPAPIARGSDSNVGHVEANEDRTGVDLYAGTGSGGSSPGAPGGASQSGGPSDRPSAGESSGPSGGPSGGQSGSQSGSQSGGQSGSQSSSRVTTTTEGKPRRDCGRFRTVYVADQLVPASLVAGSNAHKVPFVRPGSDGEEILTRRSCRDINSNGVVVNVDHEHRWRSIARQLRQLVDAAVGAILFTRPHPLFAPPARSRTFVGIDTWFWVLPSTWRPIVRTVSAPPVVVVATAVPTALRFTPGDGGAPVTCPGPGLPWIGGGVTPCSYTYQRASTARGGLSGGRYAASMAKLWMVYWTSNTGASGVIGPTPMTTPVSVKVAEAEAVLRRPV